MWMYTSLEPWHPFLNFRMDNDLWQPRLLLWQSAQLRMSGLLYWGINYWGHATTDAPHAKHTPIDGATMTGPFVPVEDWNLVYAMPDAPTKPSPNNVGDGQLT